MADPYRKYAVGDRPPREAVTFNAFAAGARLARDSGRTLSASELDQTRQADIVLVKNDSGRDLARRHVLGLNGPLFDPADAENAFLREVTFSGVVPTSGHVGKFAILLEPAKAGRLARAYVSGVCQVRLDVLDPSHTTADITSGDTYALATSTSGSAQILWQEPGGAYDGGPDPYYYGDGTKWAIVRFGGTVEGATLARVTTDCPKATPTAYGKGGFVTIQTDNGTKLVDGPQTGIAVKNLVTKKIVAGANSWVLIIRALGSWWVVAVYDCSMLT